MSVDAHTLLRQVEADLDDVFGKRRELLEEGYKVAMLLVEVRRGAAGGWRSDAACRGQVDVMFPTRGEPTGPGKALCAGCQVFDRCAEWAEATNAGGISAGQSRRPRRNTRR